MNSLKFSNDKKEYLKQYSSILKNICFISGFFCIIISLIIILNFIFYKEKDPINSPLLKSLIKKSHIENTNMMLTKEIRDFDLLTRKAFFTSITFTNYGKKILIFWFILFLFSLKLMYECGRNLPNPITLDASNNHLEKNSILQIFIISVIIIFSLVSIFISKYNFKPLNKKIIKKNTTEKIKQNIISFYDDKKMKNNWPHFRGFNSQGIAYNVNPPTFWDVEKNLNILWKFKFQKKGFNSPIIWEDKVFFAVADKLERSVIALDLNTGNLIFKQKTKTSNIKIEIPETTEDTGLSAPSLTTNGYHVAALFGTGEIIVLDIQGNVIWEKLLPTPKNHYGHSSSLISYNNSLFLQYDSGNNPYIYAYNFSNGNLLWSHKRDVEISWSSPIIVEHNLKREIILTADPKIISYDLVNGNINWTLNDILYGELGASPAYIDGKIFFANQFATLACFDINTKNVLWNYDEDLPDASSPVAYNNTLVLPSSFGKITFLDIKTGQEIAHKKNRIGYYSSPIIADDKIYLINKKGSVFILDLINKFSEIAKIDMKDPIVATPAFKDNKIIIRTSKFIICIQENNL